MPMYPAIVFITSMPVKSAIDRPANNSASVRTVSYTHLDVYKRQPYIKLDAEYAQALAYEKQVNFQRIYEPQDKNEPYPTIKKMFERVYEKLLQDFEAGDERTPIFRHHINHVYRGFARAAGLKEAYLKEEPNQVVVDYIASMTDDYFMDLHEFLFPDAPKLEYISYFSKKKDKR